MIITVASFKGGVGKTTTAVHLAAFFHLRAPTVLVDGDPNRSVTHWDRRGHLPFKVIDERHVARHVSAYQHVVIDTEARPDNDDLKALAEGCDLLVVPTTPDALSLDALMLTIDAFQQIGATNYRVLLTMIPPKPSRDGEDARQLLQEAHIPLFAGTIRRLVAFQKAALQGKVVLDVHDPRADHGWADYTRIGEEIAG